MSIARSPDLIGTRNVPDFQSNIIDSKEQEMREILANVEKPGRYLGGEPGSVSPKPTARVRWVLAFPDIYDIGMSHLGLKILYSIINELPEASCERVFAPWIDYENELRNRNIRLTSLETGRPLSEFDVVGFSLQHEMLYSNVLNMLDLSGIPLISSERSDDHPIVIAGGPSAVNPEPMADFIDAFVVGEGEDVAKEITEAIDRCKAHRLDRQSTLKALANLKGVYVPSFYEPIWKNDGTLETITPKDPALPTSITKRTASMRGLPYPVCQAVSLVASVHDRLSVEIRRGCSRGCRFCQAGFITRPVRERPVDEIVDLGKRALVESGYDELSLMSLSSGDYSQIGALLADLHNELPEYGGHLVVPSLRLDRIPDGFLEKLSFVKQRSLTFAPEAGSERLRSAINKDLTDEEIFSTVQKTFSLGWKTAKLYFMVGLPTETQDDLEAIVDLVNELRRSVKSGKGQKRKEFHISISPFVPKPHTPFQWSPQLPIRDVRERVDFLADRIRGRDVKFKWHELERSLLEGVFSRGDRRLGQVILQAWKSGVKMDNWTACFDHRKWEDAFDKVGVDPSSYTTRERDKHEFLPWDVIDVGVTKDFLWSENEKALRNETTEDCFVGRCSKCGACSDSLRVERADPVDIQIESRDSREQPDQHQNEPPHWYRVEFAKPERSCFLSNLDIQRLFVQALHRTRLPLRMTQGFHPRPKCSFGMAIPFDLVSHCENCDFALSEERSSFDVQKALSKATGEVLEVRGVRYIGRKRRSLVELTERIVYQMSFEPSLSHNEIKHLLDSIDGKEEKDGQNGENTEVLDMQALIDSICILPQHLGTEAKVLEFSVPVKDGRTPKPRDLCAWIGSFLDEQRVKVSIKKVATLGRTSQGDFVSLLELPITRETDQGANGY